MLYSQSLESDKFTLFTIFLKSILDGQENYKSYVDGVFTETKELAVQHKDVYNIDRENYHLIVYLSEKLTGFFTGLSDNYSEKEYETVLTFLEEQKDSIASEL